MIMARVKQYPHYLFIDDVTESVQDEQGNWTESTATKTFVSMCRVEVDGKGTEYEVAGGEYHKATAVIQLPTSCPKIEKGANVTVSDDAECTDIRITGICLNFDKAQLHSRLWV